MTQGSPRGPDPSVGQMTVHENVLCGSVAPTVASRGIRSGPRADAGAGNHAEREDWFGGRRAQKLVLRLPPRLHPGAAFSGYKENCDPTEGASADICWGNKPSCSPAESKGLLGGTGQGGDPPSSHRSGRTAVPLTNGKKLTDGGNGMWPHKPHVIRIRSPRPRSSPVGWQCAWRGWGQRAVRGWGRTLDEPTNDKGRSTSSSWGHSFDLLADGSLFTDTSCGDGPSAGHWDMGGSEIESPSSPAGWSQLSFPSETHFLPGRDFWSPRPSVPWKPVKGHTRLLLGGVKAALREHPDPGARAAETRGPLVPLKPEQRTVRSPLPPLRDTRL